MINAKLRKVLLSTALATTLAGCGGGDGSDAGRVRDEGADGKQPRKFRIAVIPKGPYVLPVVA